MYLKKLCNNYIKVLIYIDLESFKIIKNIHDCFYIIIFTLIIFIF